MKKPLGQGQVILYLDFDGVLHHDDVWWHPRRGAFIKAPGHRLLEHMHLLEAALQPYPSLRIVLSTSWVHSRKFSRALGRLSSPLQQRVIGATFHSKMNPDNFQLLPRGVQVHIDAHRRGPRDWFAVDDGAEGWPPNLLHKLFRTDGTLGLRTPGVLDALHKRLQQLCE